MAEVPARAYARCILGMLWNVTWSQVGGSDSHEIVTALKALSYDISGTSMALMALNWMVAISISTKIPTNTQSLELPHRIVANYGDASALSIRITNTGDAGNLDVSHWCKGCGTGPIAGMTMDLLP